MKYSISEILIGVMIIIVAGVSFFYAYEQNHSMASLQAHYKARFNAVDGLIVGSDVRLAGVRVGTVLKIEADPETYLAEVEIGLMHDIPLPDDSSAQIVSDGLLGGKYLSLSPGGSEANLEHGDVIAHTQSAINFEDLIGKAIFSSTNNNKDKKENAAVAQ